MHNRMQKAAARIAIKVTDAAYRRSHAQAPRGRGGWLFQRSAAWVAFDRDLTGPIISAPTGTYGEALIWLRMTQEPGLYAVLP